MPIISFWGTEDTSVLSSTSIATAVASSIATRYPYRTLITQTHYNDYSLESAFFDMDKLSRKGSLDISDTGVDALDRLLRSNKLTPENISNYAKSKMNGRLELLYGTFKNDPDSYTRILETFPLIIDYASQFYDIVLVDLNKGFESAEVNSILQKSDLIVLSMCQSREILKKVFKSIDTLKILQEKPIITVLGRYDRFSVYASRNISRHFNYKKPIYTIPYNTQFFDACNEGRVIDFFASNINADIATDRNGFFLGEVSKCADAIIEAIKPKLIER